MSLPGSTGLDGGGRLVAEITFPCTQPGIYTIDHTFVDPSLRGQGMADKLVRAALEQIRKTAAPPPPPAPMLSPGWRNTRSRHKNTREKAAELPQYGFLHKSKRRPGQSGAPFSSSISSRRLRKNS